MSYQFRENLTYEEYNAFAKEHPLYNLYQSAEWSKVKKEWHHLFTGVYEEDKCVAGGLVLYRDLPLGLTMFYLAKGPLIDFENEELLAFYFNNLKKIAKKHHAIMVRMDPDIIISSTPWADIKEHQPVRNHPVIEKLAKLGFVHHGFNLDMYETSVPRYDACYYYTENWRNGFSAKAMKSIRKATNKGVELEVIGTDKLDIFATLMSCTEKRKGVSLRNQEYFKRLMDVYGDNAFVCLTKVDIEKQLETANKQIAELEETISKHEIAQHKLDRMQDQVDSMKKNVETLKEANADVIYISCLLGVKIGKTAELLYAGMDETYRKYLATYVSYYAGIEWASDAGCTRCDFGGIPGTLDDGLTEFKSYFDPNIDEYIGEFDQVINPVMYWAFTNGVPLYKKVRRKIRELKK